MIMLTVLHVLIVEPHIYLLKLNPSLAVLAAKHTISINAICIFHMAGRHCKIGGLSRIVLTCKEGLH